MFANLPVQLPNIKAGRVRAFAVTSARRAEQLPEVPTFIESGVPGFEVTVWEGLAVPTGTPKPILAKLHSVMMKVLASPDLRQRFVDQGVSAAPMTSEEFAALIASETVKWAKVVKDAKVIIE
jgi:tripartite-type tricarboxylate transporter receptor subunit TctC